MKEAELRSRTVKLTVNEAASYALREHFNYTYKRVGSKMLRHSGGVGVSAERARRIYDMARRKLNWAAGAVLNI